MLLGVNLLGRRLHAFCACAVAIGTLISAFDLG
jgi:cytochrome bd-type quinol oxidase subunit 1